MICACECASQYRRILNDCTMTELVTEFYFGSVNEF